MMAQARKMRATAGNESSGVGYQESAGVPDEAGVQGFAGGGQAWAPWMQRYRPPASKQA